MALEALQRIKSRIQSTEREVNDLRLRVKHFKILSLSVTYLVSQVIFFLKARIADEEMKLENLRI